MTEDLPWGSHAFTATDLHSLPQETTYQGALSFLRRPWRSSLDGLDVAVAGVPFDTATTNRPGARFGPRAIREASSHLAWEPRVYGFDFHPVERLAIADLGDLHLDFTRPAGVPAQIETAARRIVDAGVSLLALGGDHFVSYPLLCATAARQARRGETATPVSPMSPMRLPFIRAAGPGWRGGRWPGWPVIHAMGAVRWMPAPPTSSRVSCAWPMRSTRATSGPGSKWRRSLKML